VKLACVDTSWIVCADLPNLAKWRVHFARLLQAQILEKACNQKFDSGPLECGTIVGFEVLKQGWLLPSWSYDWARELPSLYKARSLLDHMHPSSGSLPGDNLAAAALLFQAAAELERGLGCPAGFGKRLALSK
jgi:hypothetical protein